MAITIKTDHWGKQIIWSEVGGKPVPLPAADVYIRAADGHVRIGKTLEPLRPHEVAMVEFWLRERASEITTLVFAGETPPAKPEPAPAAGEPAPDG